MLMMEFMGVKIGFIIFFGEESCVEHFQGDKVCAR